MAAEIELNEGEVIEKEFASDYWTKTLIFMDQKRGRYWFTNERFVFKGGWGTEIDVPYNEITSVEKCCVGPLIRFVPAIKVTTKYGHVHYLSLTKRKENLEYLSSKITL